MKKLLLISMLVVFVSSLFAQEKGDMVISGSLSWTSKSTKEKAGGKSEVAKGTRNFKLIPEFRYFVCDKLSVGLGIGYALNKEPNGNSNSKNPDDELFNKIGLFLLQPSASYYISLADNFYFVPRFYVEFGIGKYKVELDGSKTEDTDISAFNIGLSLLSFEFKPCEKIGIMFDAGNLEYKTETFKYDSDNKSTERHFSLGLNLGATIGFNYYF